MTGAQASYLKTLSEECGELEAFAPDLTKAEAAKRIDVEVVRRPPEVDTPPLGATVKLWPRTTFRIVGEDEGDPSEGTVSSVSPLARAVITCGPGDRAEIAGRKAR